MRLVRFGPAGQERPGIVDSGGAVRDACGLVPDWSGDTLDAVRRLAQVELARLPEVPGDARLGCPVVAPGKIVCVGLNYADHAAETCGVPELGAGSLTSGDRRISMISTYRCGCCI